jgi:Ca2+-binding RTX toxin-like protein
MATAPPRSLHRVVACAVCVTVALVIASFASATFPGLNGSIAFIRFFDAEAEIVAVDLSGGVVFHSAYFGASDYDPAWSPDGRRLAFTRLAIGGDGIYVVDAWGDHLRRVARSIYDSDPSWAPSGDKIAYNGKGGIWVVNADGSGAHQISKWGGRPSWSPDGEAIAVGRRGEIFLMRPDGSDRHKILDGAAPRWAPDGSQLTYLGGDEDETEVWVAQRDGSGAHPITSAKDDLWPTWSPDGEWIAFSRLETRPGRSGLFEIHLIRPDGSGLRPLTTGSDDLVADWQPLRCTQTGTADPDLLVGTPAPDVLCGKAGGDTLRAVGGDDILVGAYGSDYVKADTGRALLYGGSGDDRLVGGHNNDVLAGGLGADLLRGGPGE